MKRTFNPICARIPTYIPHAGWNRNWSNLLWFGFIRYLPKLVQYDLLQTLIALLHEPSVVRMSMPPALCAILIRAVHAYLLTRSNAELSCLVAIVGRTDLPAELAS